MYLFFVTSYTEKSTCAIFFTRYLHVNEFSEGYKNIDRPKGDHWIQGVEKEKT
jgi:hypothetical protein